MLELIFKTFCYRKKGMVLLFLFSIINFQGLCIYWKKDFKTEPKSKILNLKSKVTFHAFHTSITQIEYNAKAKTYEISIRLFTDDFERALDIENKIKGTRIQDDDKNDAIVSAYALKHFSIISPQNKKATLKYFGKENEELATWIYFELPAEQLTKGSKIQQIAMMELFDDQVNILNYRHGDERKTLIFDSKNKLKILE